MTFIDNDDWALRKDYEYFAAFQITCVAQASLTTGDYFLFKNGSGDKYFLWMDFNGDGATDIPTVGGGYTGVQVDLSAGSLTAAEVATAVQTAIDALANNSAIALGAIVTVENASNQSNSSMTDSNTDFTFATLGYKTENDFPTASMLNIKIQDADSEIMQFLDDAPTSGDDYLWCQNLEYKVVEKMLSEEVNKRQQLPRDPYTPMDYIGSRDRTKLTVMNSTSSRRSVT